MLRSFPRFAVRAIKARSVAPSVFRSIPTTTVRYASNLPNLPPGFDQNSPLFQKILQAPAVLEAVTDITKLFERKGIAMDRKPSFTEMMKLAQDAELQQAMQKLKREMDSAGISVDIQKMLQSMPGSK